MSPHFASLALSLTTDEEASGSGLTITSTTILCTLLVVLLFHRGRRIRKSCSSFLSPRLQKLFLGPSGQLCSPWQMRVSVFCAKLSAQKFNSSHLALRLCALTFVITLHLTIVCCPQRLIWLFGGYCHCFL